MAYVSKIEYDGAFYDIQDAVAQEKADTATSAAESAVATAEAAETAAASASETAEEAKAIAQGVAGSYSVDELDTGSTWIDGRHIYKKTIPCRLGAVGSGTEVTLSYDIVVENIDFFIKSELLQKTENNAIQALSPTIVTSNRTTLVVVTPVGLAAAAIRYCTIYYVKTA